MADPVALIDTGASITAVHPELIHSLKPQEIGVADMGRVEQERRLVPTYYFTIRFDDPGSGTFGVEVVAARPASPCQVLIGRALLCRWVLSWDGIGDQLLISY
jgi:hypothetical protein